MLLFNAVSKAQRARQEAAAVAGKGKPNAKATREAFLTQLKQQQQQLGQKAAAQVRLHELWGVWAVGGDGRAGFGVYDAREA